MSAPQPQHPDASHQPSPTLGGASPAPLGNPATAAPPVATGPAVNAPAVTAPARPARRSGMAGIWLRIGGAAVVTIALIIFILQNTRSVEVSYFGASGTLPLAMALLIAAVGGALIALVFGALRLAQRRRRTRSQSA